MQRQKTLTKFKILFLLFFFICSKGERERERGRGLGVIFSFVSTLPPSLIPLNFSLNLSASNPPPRSFRNSSMFSTILTHALHSARSSSSCSETCFCRNKINAASTASIKQVPFSTSSSSFCGSSGGRKTCLMMYSRLLSPPIFFCVVLNFVIQLNRESKLFGARGFKGVGGGGKKLVVWGGGGG